MAGRSSGWRTCPAADTFLGYDASRFQLWSLGRAPYYGDDGYFDGTVCNDSVTVGVIGPWSSIHLVNGYTGTVSLNSML